MSIIFILAIAPVSISIWAGLQHLGWIKPFGEKGRAVAIHCGLLLCGLMTIPKTLVSALYLNNLVSRFHEIPTDKPDHYYPPGADDVFFLDWVSESYVIFLFAVAYFLMAVLGYFMLLPKAARKKVFLIISLILSAIAFASFALDARFPSNW